MHDAPGGRLDQGRTGSEQLVIGEHPGVPDETVLEQCVVVQRPGAITAECVTHADAQLDTLPCRIRRPRGEARSATSGEGRGHGLRIGDGVVRAEDDLRIAREHRLRVDLRRDLFTLNYPNRTRDMALAYTMATRPSPDAMKALVFIDGACRWMTPMTDAWLNANNPQRAERLKA